MNEQKDIEKQLFEMKVGMSIALSNEYHTYFVLRVPTGWIFYSSIFQSVFVPLTTYTSPTV